MCLPSEIYKVIFKNIFFPFLGYVVVNWNCRIQQNEAIQPQYCVTNCSNDIVEKVSVTSEWNRYCHYTQHTCKLNFLLWIPDDWNWYTKSNFFHPSYWVFLGHAIGNKIFTKGGCLNWADLCMKEQFCRIELDMNIGLNNWKWLLSFSIRLLSWNHLYFTTNFILMFSSLFLNPIKVKNKPE